MAETLVPLSRAAFIDRLRHWAARADNEINYSQHDMRTTWEGHASVLRGVLGTVSGGTGGSDNVVPFRKQIIADRQKAITAWEQARDPHDVAYQAGEVQGYNLILELLKDAGDGWA